MYNRMTESEANEKINEYMNKYNISYSDILELAECINIINKAQERRDEIDDFNCGH